MWYLIIVLMVIVGVFFSYNNKLKANIRNQPNTQNLTYNSIPGNPTDTIEPMYSIKDIKKKLKTLAETEPPKDLFFGAMCYKVAAPPTTASYTCPVCQQKSLYKLKKDGSGHGNINLIQWGINSCRNEIKKVKGINIILDESQFCKKCSPDIEDPQLCLKINIASGGKTNNVCNINYSDIRLIVEFLNGELKHKGGNDRETPLKDYMKRIEELLGIKSEE